MRILYYVILSLYGSINAVIGLQILIHYLMDPELFAGALSDVVVASAMLLIGILCLFIFIARGRPSRRLVFMKRYSSLILSFIAIPMLIVSLVINFLDNDSVKPAYCDLNPDTTSSEKYTCDIRAIDLDELNDPNLTYAEDFASGRSAKVFIADSVAILVATGVGTMVTIYTLRDKRYKSFKA